MPTKMIRVKTETYDRLNSLGSITSSFDSVIVDLIKKANVIGASASVNTEGK